MARVHLFHAAGAERAAELRAAGHRVAHSRLSRESLLALRASPPDAIVVDLDRMPSLGMHAGLAVRRSKATRGIPLVFLGGAAEKTERVRRVLPDATYAEWPRCRSAVRAALARPAREPLAAPDSWTVYAGTPLAKKLGISAGARVALIGAPAGIEASLGPLPEGAVLARGARGARDMTLWFVRSNAELRAGIGRMARHAAKGRLWIAWPKQGGPIDSDVKQTDVRATAIDAGLVDFKVCAVDAAWSAFRLAPKRA